MMKYLLTLSLLCLSANTAIAQSSGCEEYASEGSDAHQFKKDDATAEKWFLAALSEKNGCGGKTLLSVMTQLGAIYVSQNRYAEAEPLFEESLDLAKVVKGTKHPDIPRYTMNVALVYGKLGRLEESERLYKQALERTEQIYGAESTYFARALENYARYLQEQKRDDEAQKVERRAKAIHEKHRNREQ